MFRAFTKAQSIISKFKYGNGNENGNIRLFTTIRKISNSEYLINKEMKYGAHNYQPIPVVIDRTEGSHVWDADNKHYYDFLSAYSAVNQGHLHPELVRVTIEQLKKCTLTSRAFHNSVFPEFAEKITKLFNYDKVLPMNTGAEAVETAIKIARKWGYEKKGIQKNKAQVVVANGCFHGRTTLCISLSDDPTSYSGFGPYVPNITHVNFNNLNHLKKVIAENENICAVMFEPIQGEAGVIVPDKGYLSEVHKLCRQNNILFIADEVQTGLGRTGKLLASHWDDVHADITILGKALGGGIFPVSAVLANDDIMDVMTPGIHGSTFGGNPLACKIAIKALDIILDEELCEKANSLGEIFRNRLIELDSPYIKEVRGKGLLNAVELKTDNIYDGDHFCKELVVNQGILCKPTHKKIIRFAPPLTFDNSEFNDCLNKICSVFKKDYVFHDLEYEKLERSSNL